MYEPRRYGGPIQSDGGQDFFLSIIWDSLARFFQHQLVTASLAHGRLDQVPRGISDFQDLYDLI